MVEENIFSDLKIREKLYSSNINSITYLRLVILMIQADGILHPREADFFLHIAKELGLSQEELDAIQMDFVEIKTFEELIPTLEIPESFEARKVLLELMLPVALSDGELHPTEVDFFHELQTYLGIEQVILDRK